MMSKVSAGSDIERKSARSLVTNSSHLSAASSIAAHSAVGSTSDDSEDIGADVIRFSSADKKSSEERWQDSTGAAGGTSSQDLSMDLDEFLS